MPMIHQSSCFGKATRPHFNKRNNAEIKEENGIAPPPSLCPGSFPQGAQEPVWDLAAIPLTLAA